MENISFLGGKTSKRYFKTENYNSKMKKDRHLGRKVSDAGKI